MTFATNTARGAQRSLLAFFVVFSLASCDRSPPQSVIEAATLEPISKSNMLLVVATNLQFDSHS